MPPSIEFDQEIVSDDAVYNNILSVEPPPSTAVRVFAVFAASIDPFAIVESPVPPSATARSVIPVIEPPVIATEVLSIFATRVAAVYPVPLTSTVVPGSACRSLKSLNLIYLIFLGCSEKFLLHDLNLLDRVEMYSM